ncbi:MAG TPA: zf-HC2 domain-containing protein [Anaeromyxobacter sp.]
MTHHAFAEKLLDLAYGELPPREAGKVEAHAASCEACRAELARIRETRRLMSALPEEPAPERGERILFAAAREAAERGAPRRVLPPWLLGATVVAASLVAVGAVSYRILAMRPGPLMREDPEALLGPSPYAARPPAPASPAPESAERPAEVRSLRADREEPAGAPPKQAERKKAAPARGERRSIAYAEPPPPVEREAPPASGPPAVAAAPPAPAEDARSPAPLPPAAAAGAVSDAPRPVESERLGVARGSRPAAKAAGAPGARSELAGEAPYRSEARTFARCEGESARRVEIDAGGRVVRYVREGRIGGRRVRIVHLFRPDGSLVSATAQDLDAGGAPFDPISAGIALPERAEEAGIDAPPRCGR